ncbi:MAG: hypothetical protein LBR28_02225 [Bacteroidales bacterium]|jgi:hypothetical protein|nr:hypothetical protein [Bacteroidales bacterium]
MWWIIGFIFFLAFIGWFVENMSTLFKVIFFIIFLPITLPIWLWGFIYGLYIYRNEGKPTNKKPVYPSENLNTFK